MGARIFFSTGAFEELTLEGVIATALAEGCTDLELSSNVRCPADHDALLRFLPRSFNYLIHNYFPPEPTGLVINLASANKLVLASSLDFCRRAITLAAEIGATSYSVHSGFCVDPVAAELGHQQTHLPRIDRGAALSIFHASLEELSAFAARQGVRLCIENNVVSADNLVLGESVLDLMTSPHDYEDFLEIPQLAGIDLLIDVGHAKVSGKAEGFDPRELLELTRERTAMLHLSDNDGFQDNNRPFTTDAWFADFLPKYPEGTPMIIEAYRLSVGDRLRCASAVRNILQ